MESSNSPFYLRVTRKYVLFDQRGHYVKTGVDDIFDTKGMRVVLKDQYIEVCGCGVWVVCCGLYVVGCVVGSEEDHTHTHTHTHTHRSAPASPPMHVCLVLMYVNVPAMAPSFFAEMGSPGPCGMRIGGLLRGWGMGMDHNQ